jgi:glycosyltransferase involved in cell wall biosynthesis
MQNLALVHDWLIVYGGAEHVLKALTEIWGEAPIYTLIHDSRGPCQSFLQDRHVHTSFLQHLPYSTRQYPNFLPLMPLAIEQFDLGLYDVIFSCSHAVAHGILTRPGQMHINYIFTPARYAWHLYHDHMQAGNLHGPIRSGLARLVLHYFRLWDLAAANRVDHFIAPSRWSAANVWRAYRREAKVIYPPVDVDQFEPTKKKENFYLVVSRLVPYKKIDLIVSAFTEMPEKKLIIIGSGPEENHLHNLAGPNIEFLGYQPDPIVREHMQRAKALVQASEEDFGITAVEAQACGTPVIAYGSGGALETVLEGKTGVYFGEQKPESIVTKVHKFENINEKFSLQEIRQQADRFSKELFFKQVEQFINHKRRCFAPIHFH